MTEQPEKVTAKPSTLRSASIDALLEKRLIASLATLDADGTVHLVPMWFRRLGEFILIPTSSRTRKARNVRCNPHVSVMIQQSVSGLSLVGVLIKGRTHILEGAEARAMNRSIHLRYVTEAGLAEAPVAAYLREGDDITLRVRMETVVSWDLASGAAAQALEASSATHALD